MTPMRARAPESAAVQLCLCLLALVWLLAAATEAPAPPPRTETPPLAELVLDVDRTASGLRVAASGVLPAGLGPGELVNRVPGLRGLSEVETGGRGASAAWLGAIEAINVVLPRIATARIRMTPGALVLRGRLMPGVSVKEVRPALRSVLGPEWTLDFALEETPLPARLDVRHGPWGTVLSGILPAGLSVTQARAALGDAWTEGLTSGGEGDAAAWTRRLTDLAAILRAYEQAEATLGPEGLSVRGRLSPGQELDRIAAWAEERFAALGTVSVTGTETPAEEGARRYDPARRIWERLEDGRWVPLFEFEPTAEACDRALSGLAAGADFGFATGAAEPSGEAGPLLDRLAALLAHCRGIGDRRLLIGGHTDSVGSAEDNRQLSQARAEAVAAALAARGARRERILAIGYGAARPVADNETREGRARNRRITFDWVIPAGSRESAAER